MLKRTIKMNQVIGKCNQFSLSLVQNKNIITYNLFVDRALESEILARLGLGKPLKKSRDKVNALTRESLSKIKHEDAFVMDNN